MTLNPLSGANPVNVPATIMIGADAILAGGHGHDVSLWKPSIDAQILIAAGGNAVGAVGKTCRGGWANCIGGNECLIVAIGGHGARTPDPNPLPGPGTNGTNGGDGGEANAGTGGVGNVIYAEAGDGEPGSSGVAGRPAKLFYILGIKKFITIWPGIPNGVDGDYGNGGDAYTIGQDHADFFTTGGAASGPIKTWGVFGPTIMGSGMGGGLPGKAGKVGIGFVKSGTVDVTVTARNGDGTPGVTIP